MTLANSMVSLNLQLTSVLFDLILTLHTSGENTCIPLSREVVTIGFYQQKHLPQAFSGNFPKTNGQKDPHSRENGNTIFFMGALTRSRVGHVLIVPFNHYRFNRRPPSRPTPTTTTRHLSRSRSTAARWTSNSCHRTEPRSTSPTRNRRSRSK